MNYDLISLETLYHSYPPLIIEKMTNTNSRQPQPHIKQSRFHPNIASRVKGTATVTLLPTLPPTTMQNIKAPKHTNLAQKA